MFGNRARRVFLELPYTELIIDSHAMVVALDTDPLEFRPVHARTTIPLNWMPWQRHMLQPYLVPPELPESQLIELHDYAMSFVMRNGFDLVNSLIDVNQSIFRDYAYRQGTTTLAVAAVDRRGSLATANLAARRGGGYLLAWQPADRSSRVLTSGVPMVAADGFAWSSDGDSVAVSSPAGILVVKQTDVVYATASPVTGTVVAWPSDGAP